MSKSKCPIKVLSPRRTHHLPPLPEQIRSIVPETKNDQFKLLDLYKSSNSPMKLPPFLSHEQDIYEERNTQLKKKTYEEQAKIKAVIDNFAIKVEEKIKEKNFSETPKKVDVTFGIQN